MSSKEVRLIDANALWAEIDRIYREHFQTSSHQFIHDVFKAMFRRIKKAPTIDPESLQSNGKWISVEDSLPDKMGFYLVASRYGVVSCELFNRIGDIPIFEYELVEEGYYTHWMPLPEPPSSGAKMEG